jgi:3-phosphoshikimate 1-carboxyvinyltransferase
MYRITAPISREYRIDLPSSKSITHRALILSGLNCGTAKVGHPLFADDTRITLQALRNLGCALHVHRRDNHITCTRPLGTVEQERIVLGNSGSSARFLIPLASLVDRPVYFYGDPRLHQRPFAELFSAMRKLGIKLKPTGRSLPVTIYPGLVTGGRLTFKQLPSSQIVSAFMMMAPWMQNDLTMRLPVKTPSLPYITMTYKLMQRLGFSLLFEHNEIRLAAQRPNLNWSLHIEKDLSAASYWVIFAMLNQIKIVLPGVNLPSLQGDARIFEIAEEMGSTVMLFSDRIEIEGKIKKGIHLNCNEIPDLVPALAVLGLFAPRPSQLLQIRHLEFKESNRVEALQQNIATLGGKSSYRNGNLTIYPQKSYRGGIIRTHNDHRIAMSFAVAGTRIGNTMIDHPECVTKSYPGFWQHFTNFIRIKEE